MDQSFLVSEISAFDTRGFAYQHNDNSDSSSEEDYDKKSIEECKVENNIPVSRNLPQLDTNDLVSTCAPIEGAFSYMRAQKSFKRSKTPANGGRFYSSL